MKLCIENISENKLVIKLHKTFFISSVSFYQKQELFYYAKAHLKHEFVGWVGKMNLRDENELKK